MLNSICFNTITVVRQANTTQSSTAIVSSISISSQPKIATALSFKFTAKCTGTLTITGTSNNSATTEDVVVSNNTICQSMKRFSNITSVAFDASLVSSGASVTIKYIDMGGSSVPIETEIIDGFPINLTRNKANLVISRDGSMENESFTGLVPYTSQWSPKEFDLVTIKETNEQFMTVGSPLIEQIGINQHWVLNLKRYQR